MDSPPGMTDSIGMKVCKLNKALYGLKQSPRSWFGRFTKSMKAFGYRASNSDHTLFLKRGKGRITALIIYVDDMIVTGNDQDEIYNLQQYTSAGIDFYLALYASVVQEPKHIMARWHFYNFKQLLCLGSA